MIIKFVEGPMFSTFSLGQVNKEISEKGNDVNHKWVQFWNFYYFFGFLPDLPIDNIAKRSLRPKSRLLLALSVLSNFFCLYIGPSRSSDLTDDYAQDIDVFYLIVVLIKFPHSVKT